MNATTLFFALLAAILLVSAVDARHHKHHKRDYVYHDLEDYENRGIFIDSVTIKPTHPKDVKNFICLFNNQL
uniref:Hemocyanin_C domain-containing protein n=1 Tax=Panagrellus redivivus TaxID=6233 RepID=A0A7E4VSI8_PANRE